MKVNVPAAVIASVFGVAFFTISSTYYYQPSLGEAIDHDLPELFTTDHGKARTAVTRLLINPQSAEFRQLRSIEADAARYVCGDVRAKDTKGQTQDYRAFVYVVATDVARIDDDGRIAQKHPTFHPCPLSDEAKKQLELPPAAQAIAQVIKKAVPPVDRATLSKLASQTVGVTDLSGGGSMQQQLQELGGNPNVSGGASAGGGPGSAGSKGASGSSGQQQANAAFKAGENEWRADRPPAAWPTFPADHPLAKSARKRTAALALAMAKDVEERWDQSRSGSGNDRPTPDEIKEACRALLTIDPKSDEYAKAWASFVRLQKISRDAAS